MKKLLLASVALLALTVSSPAAVIQDLGVNPNSATGDFSNDVFGGVFTDQYTFQLVGAPQFFSFASATNDFALATDFITNFTGSLFEQVGAVGGGDDILVGGPHLAVPCPTGGTFCQILAGSATLDAGNYYLEIAGIGGGTSGYGGNLTTVPVPGPLAGAGLIPLLGLLGFAAWRRRNA
jgi:hypothetical protein